MSLLETYLKGPLRPVIRPLRDLAARIEVQHYDARVRRRHGAFVGELQHYHDVMRSNAGRDPHVADGNSNDLRNIIRRAAYLRPRPPRTPVADDALREYEFLSANRTLLRPSFEKLAGRRVLFAGQAYYNTWYLSRSLRTLGWSADVLNWDTNPATQIYYHGEDYRFTGDARDEFARNLAFYLDAIYRYDVFHFSNAHGLCFGTLLQDQLGSRFGEHHEIHLLKSLGKKIVYTNNGCLDGVSKTSFAAWGEIPVCSICRWRDVPRVCSDERNLAWGRFRNSVADFQCLLGGNRADFNISPTVHEVPEFYCLDPEVWRPDLEIPPRFRLPQSDTVRLYHGVGHRADRTDDEGVNIKCTHIYHPLIDRLRREGYRLELVEPTNVPNRDVRFIQVQADIFLDMLTYGWVGATAREAMMLGKPVIAYIRPEWFESLRREIPEYADELPIVQATPSTVEAVLLDLIQNPDKRRAIGQRSRQFAVKWHSCQAGARRFDEIYQRLLAGDPLLRDAS